MPASQSSFENLFGRFKLGVEVLRTSPLYTPLNNLLKVTTLDTFIVDVSAKDTAVNLAYEAYKGKTGERKYKSFKGKENDISCLENRIRNIHSFIGAEIGRDSAPYKIIKGFIKKIAPEYEKKEPDAPKGKGKSPSEKSFVALLGYGKQTLELITEIGAAYAPSNINIQVTGFETFLTELENLTKQITNLKKTWQDAVKERKIIYFGKDGLEERTTAIKDYLAGLEGGKKNQLYIDYVSTIKGI